MALYQHTIALWCVKKTFIECLYSYDRNSILVSFIDAAVSTVSSGVDVTTLKSKQNSALYPISSQI